MDATDDLDARRGLDFQGIHAEFLVDPTQEISLEGSLSSGKTTVGLWKELEALKRWPGVWSLIARWTDDAVTTKLIPAMEQLHDIRGECPAWNQKEKSFEYDNGSRCFMFGLKAASLTERYNKIRGLPVSRILIDQSEELPEDMAGELRARMRPDIKARLRGAIYPFQLTFISNPVDTDHWIAKQFPIDNPHKSRKYYALSLFDNAHVLPQEMIDGLLLAYPADHPKHQTVILGKRGPNVMGKPLFGGIYLKTLHHRPIPYRVEAELWEGFEFGKHNPVWVIGQPLRAGGMVLLGGIFGEGLMLDDFLPYVKQHRAKWFSENAKVRSCSSPMGNKHSGKRARYTHIDILKKHGIKLLWRDNANDPDVQGAMIENIGGYLRRRNVQGEECLGINNNPEMWLKASTDGSLTPYPFLHFAFEGGAVWSDHDVSVGHDHIRAMKDDDKFSNAIYCVENIELNFCADQPTEEQRETKRLRQAQASAQALISPSSNSWLGS